MPNTGPIGWRWYFTGALVLAAVLLTRVHGYLLFHTMAEMLSIAVAFGVFLVAWNTRFISRNSYLLHIGIALLFVAGLDLLHTLAYKGMGVFAAGGTNLPTQLWIAARYLQAVSLLLAPLLLHRAVQWKRVLAGYAGVTVLLLLSLFLWGIFPVCHVEGVGVTLFKRVSEYVISLMMVAGAVLVWREREHFEPDVLRLLLAAIAVMVAGELAFTLYIDVYGVLNLSGHLLKVVAFFLFYVAIIETSLVRPYSTLFRDLKRSEEALRDSDERFRRMVLEAPLPVMLIAEDGEVLQVNHAWTALTGYSPEDVPTYRGWATKAYGDQAEDVIAAGKQLLDYGKAMDRDYTLTTRDGERRVVHFHVAVVGALPDGRRLVLSMGSDVTERKQAEEAQRFLARASSIIGATLDTEELLARVARIVVPTLADVCVVDILDANGLPHCTAAVHADAEKQAVADAFCHCTPAPARWAGVAEALNNGQPLLVDPIADAVLQAGASDEEHLQVLRDLEMRAFLVVPLVSHGRVMGDITLVQTTSGRHFDAAAVSLATELSQRVAVGVEQARLYREAQEANQAKDQFVATVSHELRNPLAAIHAAVEVLQRMAPEGNDRMARTLEILDRNAKLQARLVNDLLDLSRLARGKMQFQRAPVALDQLVQRTTQAQISEAAEAGLTLTVDAQPALWTMGDADRLQQVLLNLLGNAIKFTPAGGKIEVTLREVGGKARLCVADTGIGIGEELLPRVFEMLHQGDVADQRKPGLGIGLALVKSITERHGGRVWAESEGPGKGSRFVVELPLTTPQREQHSVPGGAARRSVSRGTLLVVEDNPDTCALVAEGMRLAGWRVHRASSGEEALVLLERVRPDVILSDIGLPGINGYEFLRQARQLPGLERVAAFAITGLGQEEDVRRAREAGFAGHFVKPVDIGALDRRIREWLAASATPAGEGD